MKPLFTRSRALGRSILMGALLTAALSAAQVNPYYRVEDIASPPGVDLGCNGLSFLPDGRVVAAYDHGQVWIYSPGPRTWKLFAEGLHTPMGVLAISEREIVVSQRPELTRLLDTDGDGVADQYQCVSDAWGLSGNYHEFAFGLARDAAGNFYVGLGSASGGGVSRYETRGEFKGPGTGSGHYSPTPYRGWVVRIGPDGTLTPVAAGFRQPSGVGLDPAGRLFVTDNQGDWIGTSKLHHVVDGRFYGHPAGLTWRADYRPNRTLPELDQLRTEAVALLPHAIMANSPGQPAFDPSDGKFGPFAGQMFVPDYVTPRIFRVMIDEVAGEVQCAATTFFDGAPLRTANVRVAFAPDGSLWACQSERKLGWPGAAGIQRITWTGKVPLDVHAVKLTAKGFDFTFTQAVDISARAELAASFKGVSYYYQYHGDYGSPRTDIHPFKVTRTTVSEDGRKVALELDRLQPGYVYQFDLRGLRAANGDPIANPLVCYTLNRLVDGTGVTLPRPPPTGESQGTGKDKPPGARTRDGVD